MNKQILILIDIQNDYFSGGKMELTKMNLASKKASSILSFFRMNNWPVIHIQHIALKKGASFFIPETFGAEIHTSVYPINGETIVKKNYPNSFRETNLFQLLKSFQIENLVVCGAMSHMCIDTTVRAAADFGFNVTLIHDACATRSLEFNGIKIEAAKVHASYMAALSGTFANVFSASEYILEKTEVKKRQ